MLASSGDSTPRTQKITSHLSGGCGCDGNRVRIDVCRKRLYVYDRCRAPAQPLKGPVPPSEAKLAFTVKLPHSLIQRVRAYATTKRLSISEVVSRALLALLLRGRGRG